MGEFLLQPSHPSHTYIHEDDDDKVLSSALSIMRHTQRVDILAVHFDHADHAGHTYDYGPHIAEYAQAVRETDE